MLYNRCSNLHVENVTLRGGEDKLQMKLNMRDKCIYVFSTIEIGTDAQTFNQEVDSLKKFLAKFVV